MNPEIEPQKFYRSRTEKELAGVCGGIAEYFRIDPSLVRIAFAVLTIAGGQGILLYLLMWAIVPQKKYPEIDEVKDASSVEKGTGEV